MLCVLFWRGLSLDPRKLPSVQIGKLLPAFKLTSLQDESSVFVSADMQGQVALLNVWASWCASCVQEQGFLLQLAQQGVKIYGLNYKDDPMDAKQWLTAWGNPYVKTGMDRDGRVAIDLGVYGAPETFLVDQHGMIRYRHTGVLTKTVWKQVFMPQIHRLLQSPGKS